MTSTKNERWPALLDRETAAEYLGISLTTFKRMVAGSQFRPVLIHGMPRYRRSELDDFIDDLPRGDSSAAIAERSRRLNGSRRVGTQAGSSSAT